MKKTYKCIVPDYLDKFSCLAGACKNTCCHGWIVSVNKEVFYMYKRLPPNLPIKQMIDKHIKRDRKEGAGREYGITVMKPNGYCPLQDEQGLCQIQKNLGEEYLSDTCRIYPRMEYIIDSQRYRAVELSCEAAAWLALMREEPIKFVNSEEPSIDRQRKPQIADTSSPQYARSAMRYYHEMRFFTISVLQNRKYQVWERMLILGMFYNKVHQAEVEDGGFLRVPEVLAQYLTYLEKDLFREQLDKIPLRLDVQLKLLSDFAMLRRLSSRDTEFSLLFEQMMGALLPALTVDEESTKSAQVTQNAEDLVTAEGSESAQSTETAEGTETAQSTETAEGADKADATIVLKEVGELVRLQKAYDEFYLPYMKDHDYVLENYLVSSVFRGAFPLAKDGAIFDEFAKLCVIFSLVKLFLIGVGAANGGLTDELVIDVVSRMERVLTHDPVFRERIATTLKQGNMENMAYLATLLKN